MLAFMSLLRAMEYIENNIGTDFAMDDVARAAYLSVSHLNRLFVRVFGCTPSNYVVKRRLCVAARELANTARPITDIALDAQFSAPESFSRAFRRQFLMSPSQYRKRGMRFYALYPPLSLAPDEKGGYTMTSPIRKYDTSELSEKILAAKGTYILLADLDHLMEINDNLGHAAGDAALAAMASRIDRCIAEDMVFFRTGNDEFTVLTSSADQAACEDIVRRILSFAHEEVPYPGGTLKMTLSVGMALIPSDSIDAESAVERADAALMKAKQDGRDTYCVIND